MSRAIELRTLLLREVSTDEVLFMHNFDHGVRSEGGGLCKSRHTGRIRGLPFHKGMRTLVVHISQAKR